MKTSGRARRRIVGALSAVAGLCAGLVAMIATASPAAADPVVYVVNTTLDHADATPGDGVCATSLSLCTLRAAIGEAKEGPNSVPVRIEFNIFGSGVQTITLGSTLPDLGAFDPPMTIDGYTQPGSMPNTDPLVSNAAIRIHLRGSADTRSGFIGIRIAGDGNVIRGLAMTRFFKKIELIEPTATGNVIAGNFIGTDPPGTYGATSRTTYGNGIELYNGAHDNWIGEPTPAGRNVVSGNPGHGIAIYTVGADRNHIVNNIVGLNPSGTGSIRNWVEGIDINRDASDNVIGGFGAYERNVVSGNNTGGIEISHNGGTVRNLILGNFVGTDPTGTRSFSYTANGNGGINLEDGASYSIVDGNVVGNTTGDGENITVKGFGADPTVGNVIRNNRIGVSLDGRTLGGRKGVLITNIGANNRVENNIIAGHSEQAILIGANNQNDYNTITRNSIYSNGGLGIDIYPWGVNLNDPGDTDGGPNNKLNFPEFSAATTIKATGTTCAGCTVEIFRADASAGQYGDGQTFLASGIADGTGSFEVMLNGLVSAGHVITSTATDPTGNTSEFSRNTAIVAGPNEPPEAAFTVSCAELACSFDGTPSSDIDGSVESWSWDFGDGATDSGSTVDHEYASAGLRTVTLVVTDDDDANDQASEVIDVTTDLPVTIASDSFERSGTGGWGTADLGGAYTYPSGQAASFSVDGTGDVAVPAAKSRQAWLASTSASDVDAAVTMSADTAPVGSYGYSAALIMRRVALNTEYRARVRLLPDGTVRVAAVKLTGTSGDVVIGNEVVVAGVPAEVGTAYRMRAQVVGAGPTTIRIRVWRADQPESAGWQVLLTDGETALQAPGGVGLHAFVGSGTTSGVGFSFDDLVTKTTS